MLGIAHMALFVSDLAKARVFYQDFLGFEEAFKLPKPDGSDRIAFIKINDEQYLELFDEPPRERRARLPHLVLHRRRRGPAPAPRRARGQGAATSWGVGKIKNPSSA